MRILWLLTQAEGMSMKVTVCELNNDPEVLLVEWNALVSHVNSEASDLVLLPEMPFHPWIAQTNHVDTAVWQASVEAHDKWIGRLSELSPAGVISSSPGDEAWKMLQRRVYLGP